VNWEPWPQQEGEEVGDKEFQVVNELVDVVVAMIVANGLM
jgi:hypothetical protein